jgi:hypothetical protein
MMCGSQPAGRHVQSVNGAMDGRRQVRIFDYQADPENLNHFAEMSQGRCVPLCACCMDLWGVLQPHMEHSGLSSLTLLMHATYSLNRPAQVHGSRPSQRLLHHTIFPVSALHIRAAGTPRPR